MTLVSRRLVRAALVASTALAFGAPAMAAPGKGGHSMCHPGMSRLTVTGQGEARVAPDLATIQLGVTTQAASAAEAMRQNSTQQTAVIEALTGAGIDQADVQTSGLNLNPLMDYAEGRAPTVTGYQASNMVSVRVSDVARLGEVLAEAAGLTLGPVLMLRDTPAMEGPRPMMMEARAASDAKVPIAPGEVALNAMVEMQFALTGQDCGPMGGGYRHGMGHDHHGGQGHDAMSEGQSPVPDDAPVPAPGNDAAAPVPGDVPPPLGTDTGAPEAGEPVVPMGETPEGQAPAN